MANKVKMTIYVPADLYKQYKIIAAHTGKTLSKVVEDAMILNYSGYNPNEPLQKINKQIGDNLLKIVNPDVKVHMLQGKNTNGHVS